MIANLRADAIANGVRKRGLLLCLGFVLNPSLRACLLIRLACLRGKFSYWAARNALITLHSIDIGRGASIGSGLALPHPFGIVIGKGAVVGSEVTIYQGVTIGAKRRHYPTLGKGVTIYPNAMVVGDAVIGDFSIVGPMSFIDHAVEANTTHLARR